MFSTKEKQMIATAVEKALMEIDHPEMPKERPIFHLHVCGKEKWSWADIEPNWKYDNGGATTTEWNENARKYLAR